MIRQGVLWQDCGDGWQAREISSRLSGWTQERRGNLVREKPPKFKLLSVPHASRLTPSSVQHAERADEQ